MWTIQLRPLTRGSEEQPQDLGEASWAKTGPKGQAGFAQGEQQTEVFQLGSQLEQRWRWG